MSSLLGALAALAAWAIARDAARDAGLSASRSTAVAIAAGFAVAVTPLLIVQGAEPDSSAPFTVLALAACWLAPRALAERPPERRWRILLGTALGLAYLARGEAIYLAAGYAVLAWLTARGPGLRRSLPVFLPAAGIAGLWLLRQAMTWPVSPLGQLVENAWSVRATDIFAWSARPSLAAHLALGPAGLLGLRLDAIEGSAALVLLTAFPVTLLGLATAFARPRLAALPAVRLLSIGAVLTFAVDTVVFPVSSRAGLYAHGAGPTVVLLAVLAGLGLETLVARLARVRRWPLPRTAAAPLALLPAVALVALALPLAFLSATLEQERSSALATEYGALSAFASRWGIPADRPLLSDHPMWINAALGRPAVVLPREHPDAIADLARHFGAAAIVVREADGGDVAAALADWKDPAGVPCFSPLAAPPPFVALAFTCLSP